MERSLRCWHTGRQDTRWGRTRIKGPYLRKTVCKERDDDPNSILHELDEIIIGQSMEDLRKRDSGRLRRGRLDYVLTEHVAGRVQ